MTPRYHTYGNAQSWRSKGYLDRCSVPGPLERTEQPINYGIIALPIVVALVVLMVAL